MIPHKTYIPNIPHIPAFVYLVCFYSQSILSWYHFQGIIFRPVLCSALFFFSVYTNLNFNRFFFSTFQIFLQIFNKKYYNLTFLQQFFNTCYLFGRNGANVCDTQIYNISLATDDDIIQFGDDVNIYPCIFILCNYHLWKLS